MIRVAIFEDNSSLREGMFHLINGTEGYACVGAYANCDRIIRCVEEAKPDVILMDIEMPGINGIEGTKLVKENFPDVKVLMQTIFEDNNKIFQSICNGAEGYILKNTSPVQILEAVKNIHEGGSPMTPGVASKVLKMLKSTATYESRGPLALTPSEKEILVNLTEGMSCKVIANTSGISIETVGDHIKSIYKKLRAHFKSDAVIKSMKSKIMQ